MKTDKIHYLKSGLNCYSLRASPTGANWAENLLSSTCCCDCFILRLCCRSCLPIEHRLTLIQSIKNICCNTARSLCLCPDRPRLFPPCLSLAPEPLARTLHDDTGRVTKAGGRTFTGAEPRHECPLRRDKVNGCGILHQEKEQPIYDSCSSKLPPLKHEQSERRLLLSLLVFCVRDEHRDTLTV